MFTWLSTTQHKINAGLALFALTLACLFAYSHLQRESADRVVQAQAARAAKAVAVDSTKQAMLKPQIARLAAEVAAIKKKEAAQEITNILNAKKDERTNKQLDSLNAILGVRPPL
jgi:septal ring factor EnvC (AmiA/AmiB activator)